jgi:hypothetical protein
VDSLTVRCSPKPEAVLLYSSSSPSLSRLRLFHCCANILISLEMFKSLIDNQICVAFVALSGKACLCSGVLVLSSASVRE